ncbi:hypothetical protein PM10SUCC1_14010 [Propionigenium maris DSM 9537]|uniref:Adhesion protein FadA n=1 Tax=Propionigenium maris DSM 9537 TaxID=1123000 RepID=A0A9W6GLR0_9FUSO|nr:hypothetical protein [Propionigenium maris]GLI55887.1 hypothetical protein PM10SUCC1_14010 [Propionigenium maris DSM 9537]
MKKLLILTILISGLTYAQGGGGSGGMQGFNQYITSEFEDVRQEIKEVDEREMEYTERMSRGLAEDAALGADQEAIEKENQELKEEKAKIMILKSIE